MAGTTLTPLMSKLIFGAATSAVPFGKANCDTVAPDSDTLRVMVHDALSKGVFSTACFLAEMLTRQADVTKADIILFAQTYFSSGEHRRCLAVLEHKGLLSAYYINELSAVLLPDLSGPSISSSGSKGTPLAVLQDILSALHLATQCLFALEQYSDCVHLLEPVLFLDRNNSIGISAAVERARSFYGNTQSSQINLMASIYSIVGRCFDLLDNGPHAICAFTTAIRIDAACVEVVDYISANGLFSSTEKRSLFYDVLNLSGGREWLEGFYRFHLLDSLADMSSCNSSSASGSENSPSTMLLVRRAEQLFEAQCPTDAYRLARQAYTLDPFDARGLLIYIAAMVELGLKTELFYLGHELANNYPKLAVSWYAVGCYYFICKKLELAQKYLQKATKINKRFAKAWIALGHVLAAQEESEHAISAFRSASRLLPGDHRPLIYMAKELVRTNYLPLALHILTSALQLSPNNAVVLNEIGVIYLKQEKLQLALEHLSAAVQSLKNDELSSNNNVRGTKISGKGNTEIYSNYATCLRRCKRFDEALHWYRLCLAYNPSDANIHANIGYTLHLSKKLDDAINVYHKALALQPTFTFCSEMLSRAMNDLLELDVVTLPEEENVDNGVHSFSQVGEMSMGESI